MAQAAKYIVALGVALAGVCALAGAVAAQRYGAVAYQASAVAAVLNWVAGSMALGTVFVCRNTTLRAQSVLLAMAVRIALPLAAMVVVTRSQLPLAQVGLGGLIVVHYLAGLVFETVMSVRLVATADAASSVNAGRLALDLNTER